MRNLRADGLRQGIRHGPVIERTQQPAAAVHGQVARRPNHRSSHVRRKNRVFGGQLIDDLGHVLRVDGQLSRLPGGQIVQVLAGLVIVGQRCVQVAAVLLLLDRGQQRAQGFRDAAHHAQIDAGAPSQLLLAQVDLHDARFFRVKLLIGEIRSHHQQRVAVHHGVVAGGEAQQAGHAYVVGVVVFDELLAAQGVHDGSLQRAGQRDQFVMRSGAARPGQDGHLLSAVQLRGQQVQLFPAGNNLRLRVGEGDAAILVDGIGERHIAGDDDDRDTLLRQGRLDGDFKKARHLRRMRHQLAEVAALLEQQLGVRLLKVVAANFRGGNMRGDGQHRHAAALAVVEAVDQVQIARPAASGADRQLARQGRFGSGGEGGRLFVPHADPLDPAAHSNRIGDAVERIARHAINALHTGGGQNVRKQLCNFLRQGLGFFRRLNRKQQPSTLACGSLSVVVDASPPQALPQMRK